MHISRNTLMYATGNVYSGHITLGCHIFLEY